jgi:hypothetical protein
LGWILLILAIEALVFWSAVSKLNQARQLEREVHATACDLALALLLASEGQYREGMTMARRFRTRMDSLKRRTVYRPPTPPPHPDCPDWSTRFAP